MKDRYINHTPSPEALRAKREGQCTRVLGGKAVQGPNFTENGTRLVSQRKGDDQKEFHINSDGVTVEGKHPLQREHDDVNKLAEALGFSDEEEGKADA